MIILLVVQGLVFAIWAYHMFRAVFRLYGHAVRKSGRMMPGFGAQIGALQAFLAEPAFRSDRRRLFLATAALAVLTLAFAILGLEGGWPV